MEDVIIASAVRTAVGKFNGELRGFSAQRLGTVVVEEAIKRAGIEKKAVDEVLMGNVVSAGLGQNPARQVLIYAGLPENIGATTINKVCGSGLKAVMIGADAIKAGNAEIIVAGGMESMTSAPYLLKKARFGYRLMNGKLIDAMVNDGLWDVYNNFHMGMTGEIIAEKYGVSREEMDDFALHSHKKAIEAIKNGKFKAEIVPIEKKDNKIFDTDEGPRENTTLERLARLKPVFKKDGKVTAGNVSQISDGASALVIMSEKKAKELKIDPLATITDYATSGCAPELVMEAPIPTVRKLFKKSGLNMGDIDLFEHNEAFASASVVIRRELNVPNEIFNVHGGAVALGHPIGCSGARVLTTLLYAMKDMGKERGLATICLGGGNAVAMIVER
jgi:acetyl-CoA C-acetyltransferase